MYSFVCINVTIYIGMYILSTHMYVYVRVCMYVFMSTHVIYIYVHLITSHSYKIYFEGKKKLFRCLLPLGLSVVEVIVKSDTTKETKTLSIPVCKNVFMWAYMCACTLSCITVCTHIYVCTYICIHLCTFM